MRELPLYAAEITDGLGQKLRASGRLAWASLVEASRTFPAQFPAGQPAGAKASASDSDLYPLQSILVSTGWNLNDDVFDPEEVWAARFTPTDKQLNNEHDCAQIIGHMTDCFAADADGKVIANETAADDLPDLYDLYDSGVLYRYWEKEDLQKKMDEILGQIAQGKKFVSMECYFANFDYAILPKAGGQKVVARNGRTAFLTKHLKAYGGDGTYQGDRVGRLLRTITFSGKGLVDNPANPRSKITDHAAAFRAGAALVYSPGENAKQENQDMADVISEAAVAARIELETKVAGLTAELEAAKATHVKTLADGQTASAALKAELEKEVAAHVASKESLAKASADLEVANQSLTKFSRAATIVDKLKWTFQDATIYAGTTLGMNNEQFATQLDMALTKFNITKAAEVVATPVVAPVAVATKVTAEQVLDKVVQTPELALSVASATKPEAEQTRADIAAWFSPAKKTNKTNEKDA